MGNPAQDWFAANAPQVAPPAGGGDWFAQNAPKVNNLEPTQFERDRLSPLTLAATQRNVMHAANPTANPLPPVGQAAIDAKVKDPAKMAASRAVVAQIADPRNSLNNVVYPGTGTTLRGIGDVATGNFAKGAHEVISGGSEAVAPFLPSIVLRMPVSAGLALLGGTGGSVAARKGAEMVGATPDQADLTGDVGGIVGGGALAGGPKALSAMKPTLVPAAGKVAGFLSDVIPPKWVGLGSPRLANWMQFLGELSDVIKAPEQAEALKSVPVANAPAEAAAVPVNGTVQFGGKTLTLTPDIRAKVQGILNQAKIDTKAAVAEAQPTTRQELQSPTADFLKKKLSRADLMDDKAVAQEMNWNLEKEGYRALSDEKQKFFADNGPALTKNQLATQQKVQTILEQAAADAQAVLEAARVKAEVPARFTETKIAKAPTAAKSNVAPGVQSGNDLTDLLQRSIDVVRKRKDGGK